MSKIFFKNKSGIFLTAGLASLLLASQAVDAGLFWSAHKKGNPKISSSTESSKTEPDSATRKTLTLSKAYQLALRKSEKVALSAEEINLAKARFYRSWDYFLPTAHFLLSRTQRDATGTTGSSSGVNSDLQREVTPESKFTFTQPIFSGFKEIAALQASGADKKQQLLNWQRAKELLFVDVMDAFYAVLQAKKNVKTLSKARALGNDRLKELDERIKIGRSRNTERQTSIADLRLVESDLVQARSLLVISKRLLEFYVGDSLKGVILVDKDVPNEDFALSEIKGKAKVRSDVQAAAQGYIIAQKQVMAARADLFPTISANGNYYTRRVGFQANDDWDFTLQVNVPVFELGKTMGDIKGAVSTRESKRLLWQQSRRLAQLDIKNAYQDLQAMREVEKVLKEAAEASNENYQLISKDYRVNLVNNLEVLDALRRLEDIQIRYNETYYHLKKSYWKFRVALGDILDGVKE